jgi:peptide/nickel transport system substrate-binding protein
MLRRWLPLIRCHARRPMDPSAGDREAVVAGAMTTTPGRAVMRSSFGAAMAGALFCMAGAAGAQTLTIGLAAGPSSADPHFHALTPNTQFSQHVFEGLVGTDASMRATPRLAIGWDKVTDTLWRFRLRPDVVFHDGTPFTARDVVYSFCRVPNVANSPGLYRPYTASVRHIRTPDPLTVEIETQGPAPFLPDDLSNIAIISARAAGAPAEITYDTTTCGITEWPATSAFNAVGPVAVGTGPFRLVSFTPNQEAELARNERHWGPRPAHDRVVMRVLGNTGARTAAMLSGSVDLIERPPVENLDRLRATPGLTLVEAPSANLIYMSFDQQLQPSPAVTTADGRNPFKDVRVRQAVSMAINREAIVARILGGHAHPASQMAAPMVFGHNPAIPVERFDPEAARRLLAEAGFPNGFRLTLHTPNGRYQSDVAVAQAIAQMLTRIGIETQVESVAPSIYFTNATNQRYSFFLAGVGANMAEALMLLRALGHSRTPEFGSLNRGRYANPELDALIAEGLRTLDDARREDIARRAVALFTRDRGVLPIYQETTMWAMRRGLILEGRADQMLLAQEVRRGG